MTRTLTTLVTLCCGASLGLAQQDVWYQDRAERTITPSHAGSGEGATRYILFLGSARPWIAEVRMHVAGKPHREHWEAWLANRFAEVDANSDGQLDAEEMARIAEPRAQTPARTFFGFFEKEAAKPAVTGDTDGNGSVSPAELAAHYLDDDQGPFRVEANNDADAKLSANLAAALDRDGDQALSADELAAAVQSAAALDRNEDELLATSELQMQNQQVYQTAFNDNAYVSHDDVLDLPATDTGLADVVRRIQTRYRGEKSRKPGLARWELRWSNAEVFERFDADDSGRLEDDELTTFLRDPVPDVRITVRFDSRRWWRKPPPDAPPTWVVEGLADGTQKPPVKVFNIFGNRRRVVTGGDSFELLPPQSLDQTERNLIVNYEQQFDYADGDNNEYLDAEEARRYYAFQSLFEQLDANGDEMVYKPELRAFLERQLASARSRTRLVVADRGRNLFDLMDGNRNGTITPRELVSGKTRALGWDRDEDGKLTDAEIPRFLRLAFRPGQPTFENARYFVGSESLSSPTGQGRSNRPGAPKWFSGMDRNRDGDVSRHEFLGPLADFERLDTDGDGLMSADEAKGEQVTDVASQAVEE